jgi:transcriptional regulator with XRE-family HTH domain
VNPHTDKTSQVQPALGKAIRELRHKRGASLETLAGEAGITLNMLSLIERGEGNPTWATVRGIAAALDVSIAELAKLSLKFEDRPRK